jgi:hypothetical protein
MGNMGSIVGPQVATQLKSLLDNKVVVQGVTYTASAGVLPPFPNHCSLQYKRTNKVILSEQRRAGCQRWPHHGQPRREGP